MHARLCFNPRHHRIDVRARAAATFCHTSLLFVEQQSFRVHESQTTHVCMYAHSQEPSVAGPAGSVRLPEVENKSRPCPSAMPKWFNDAAQHGPSSTPGIVAPLAVKVCGRCVWNENFLSILLIDKFAASLFLERHLVVTGTTLAHTRIH